MDEATKRHYDTPFFTPQFDVLSYQDGILVITDTDRGGASVTNGAEWVVDKLAQEYELPKLKSGRSAIIYRDSEGNFDILAAEGRDFKDFVPLNAKDIDTALKNFKEMMLCA